MSARGDRACCFFLGDDAPAAFGLGCSEVLVVAAKPSCSQTRFFFPRRRPCPRDTAMKFILLFCLMQTRWPRAPSHLLVVNEPLLLLMSHTHRTLVTYTEQLGHGVYPSRSLVYSGGHVRTALYDSGRI